MLPAWLGGRGGHQAVPSTPEAVEPPPSSAGSPESAAVHITERAQLLDKGAHDFSGQRHGWCGWSGWDLIHDPRDGTITCSRAKMVTGTVVGVLLVAQVALALIAAFAPGASHGISKELQNQLEKTVPSGVNIVVPPGSGQPIRVGPKTRPNDTVAELLPALDDRVDYGDLLKPRYHLTPPKGWMNDPNGMMQAPGGPVHVFYQWNPDRPQWGSPWWGHVASWDLVRWIRLPPALKPDMWYDQDGVFSGSATMLPNGVPFMMYTGVMNFSQYNFYYQTQAAAVPANLSDPYFTNWTKLSSNPLNMEVPPGGTHAQFRDPITAWQVSSNDVYGLLSGMGLSGLARGQGTGSAGGGGHGRRLGEGAGGTGSDAGSKPNPKRPPSQVVVGRGGDTSGGGGSDAPDVEVPGLWMTAVGVQDDCLGAAALYLSNDSLRTWHYSGTLYSQLSQNFTEYEVCLPPPGERDAGADVPAGARGFGGHCDQFGTVCRMWECPDFFVVHDGVQAFKYSDQNRDRGLFAMDYYVLGDSTLTNYSLALVQDGHDAYSGTLGGSSYIPRPLDYGVVYASKSFRTDAGSKGGSRLLWLGWVYEDSLGCSEVCGDGTPFIAERQKWQGAQTLLREIKYSPHTQTLVFRPLPEMQQLRQPTALIAPTQLTLDTTSGGSQGPGASKVLVPSVEPLAVRQTGSGAAPGTPTATGGRQVEVDVTFSLLVSSGTGGHTRGPQATDTAPGQPQPFKLAVRINTGNGTYTDVLLNGTAVLPDSSADSAQPTGPVLQELYVWVDRTASGGMTLDTAHGGPVPLPLTGPMPATGLRLQLYVDRSILEAYVLSGTAVVTSRIYPTPVLPADDPSVTDRLADGTPDWGVLGSWGYELRGEWQAGQVKADVSVYELDSCWVSKGDAPGEDGLNG